MNNMTALVSCFVRYYHTHNSRTKVYDDPLAEKLLSEAERSAIAENMKSGISFFDPGYKGNDPLGRVVNGFLAPSVLARSAFCRQHLLNEISLGAKQYVIPAAGYDTSGYGLNGGIRVFELDRDEIVGDKIRRVEATGIDSTNISYICCDLSGDWLPALLGSGFDRDKKTFCSLLGLSFYLSQEDFCRTVCLLSENMPRGSAVVFDYPNDRICEKESRNRALAYEAGEEMRSRFSYADIGRIAHEAGLLIYEHIDSTDVDKTFFKAYNLTDASEPLAAPEGVSYCLMVKYRQK